MALLYGKQLIAATITEREVASTALATNSGLAGGSGTKIAVDVSDLSADTPVLADEIAFADVGGADTNKATLTVVNGILDHDALVNFASDEHVAHTSVDVTAGSGLTGGGDISATRTINVGSGTGITVNANDIAVDVGSTVTFSGETWTHSNGGLLVAGSSFSSTQVPNADWVASQITAGVLWKYPVLDVTQLDSSGDAVLQAIAFFLDGQPTSGDDIVISDGTTVRTYGFGAGGDVTVTIGADADETMTNLATSISGDGSGDWDAVRLEALNDINDGSGTSTAGYVVLIYRATQVASQADRIYATVPNTTPALFQYVNYNGEDGYQDPTNTQMPSGDPAELQFGPGTVTASLVAGEAHNELNGDGQHVWDADGATWVQISGTGSITAGTGLTKSGNTLNAGAGTGISVAADTINLDINGLGTDTPVLADTIAFYDSGGADLNKTTLTGINAILDHDALVNFVANEHIDWTSTSSNFNTTGTVDGGVATFDTIFMSEQSAADADAAGFGQYWVKTAVPNEAWFTDDAGNDRELAYDGGAFHDGFSDFASDEHVAHAGVTMTAGSGLTGGGTIAATRTFNVGAGEGIAVAADAVAVDIDGLPVETSIAAADELMFEDVSVGDLNKITFANFEAAVDHDALTNFVSAEHVDWAGAAAGTIHTDNYIEGGAGTDTTAIHDNVASEFAASGTIATGDLLIAEDVGSGNAKIFVTAQSIADLASAGETMTIQQITTEAITGSDTALAEALGISNPNSIWCSLNGQIGMDDADTDSTAHAFFSVSGTTMTWLASTGNAPDLETTDRLWVFMMN